MTEDKEQKHYETIHSLIEHNQEQSEKHRIAYGKEMFNLGIDHAMTTIKELKLPEGGFTYLPDLKNWINIKLEQLKKPQQ